MKVVLQNFHMSFPADKDKELPGKSVNFEPEFLILDEPTSALDISIQKEIINLLLDLQSKKD